MRACGRGLPEVTDTADTALKSLTGSVWRLNPLWRDNQLWFCFSLFVSGFSAVSAVSATTLTLRRESQRARLTLLSKLYWDLRVSLAMPGSHSPPPQRLTTVRQPHRESAGRVPRRRRGAAR